MGNCCRPSILFSKHLTAKDWESHENIEMEDISTGIRFKQRNDQQDDSLAALYKKPLESHSIFKLTVEEIHPHDRSIDFGIMKENEFEKTKGFFIKQFNNGGISFNGYNATQGVTGRFLTKDNKSVDGLIPKSVFYLDYSPNKEIKFYNDDRTLDLVKRLTGDKEKYYLFCVVSHPHTVFNIEQIE